MDYMQLIGICVRYGVIEPREGSRNYVYFKETVEVIHKFGNKGHVMKRGRLVPCEIRGKEGQFHIFTENIKEEINRKEGIILEISRVSFYFTGIKASAFNISRFGRRIFRGFYKDQMNAKRIMY